MPARDIYHDLVKRALIKEGWTITHDPYPLKFGDEDLYVDLGAEAPMAAELNGRKIAVEVKSFVGRSPMTDLERALGQFSLYGFLIEREDPARKLYLAIRADVHLAVFDPAPARDLIAARDIRLIVFDSEQEVITRWIE